MKKIQLSGTVIIEDQKILLLFKIKEKHYELPGGKVNPNENLIDAAIRETEEEIGCTPEIGRYIGHKEFTIEETTYQTHMFSGKISNQTPKIMEPEKFKKIIWMPIHKHKKFSVAQNVKEFCEDYILENN